MVEPSGDIVELNDRRYRIHDIVWHEFCQAHVAICEFEWNGKWHKVKNHEVGKAVAKAHYEQYPEPF